MIPAKHRPEWRQLLTGTEQHPFKFLALKLVMRRLKSRIEADPSSGVLDACIDELHQFAIENEKFVANDLATVFN